MSTNNEKHPLTPPHLIVRLGGLGNRKFGEANGIAEPPDLLVDQARVALQEVLKVMEAKLDEIHKDAPPEEAPHSHTAAPMPSRWKTHVLALLFGKCDRWGLQRHRNKRVQVFSDRAPLIQVLTGEAEGGDMLVRDTALARRLSNNGVVTYQHLPVVSTAPTQIADAPGMQVGEPAQKNAELETKATNKTLLLRAEAHELASTSRKRAFAYRAQSEALRHHSDLLVAIWDPDTEGKAGGTSESVEAALRERIPVIAIRLTGAQQAEIHVLETQRHLLALQGHGTEFPNPNWQKELRRVLRFLLSFPDAPSEHTHTRHAHTSAYQPRAAFAAFIEDRPLSTIWPQWFWKHFDAHYKKRAMQVALLQAKQHEQDKPKAVSGAAASSGKPPAVLAASTTTPDDQKNCAQLYQRYYGAARKRAGSGGMTGIYGNAHRGGIILSYWLAALAVLLAISGGLLHHAEYQPKWLLAGIAAAELAAIVFMYALATCSKTERWNEAYSDTRILAEALRMMEFLAPLGVHTPLPRLPYYLQKSEEATNPDRLWTIWYFRALVRMAPLKLGNLSLEAARDTVQEQANADQAQYHKMNTIRQNLLHERIEIWMSRLFSIALVFALLHILDVTWLHLTNLSEAGLLVGIGCPAVIAALHGFSSQMEVKRLQLRSSSMKSLLEERTKALAALNLTPADEAEAVWGLASEGLATASLLMDETAGWSMLYRNADIHAG